MPKQTKIKINNQQKKMLVIAFVAILLFSFGSGLLSLSVLSVSKVKIEPTGSGYLDPATSEWTGDFWFVLMTTDFDDQITAFMLANDDGTPEGTYAQTGNPQGVSSKTYATETSSGGKQLVPTSNVMVHITPGQPYYERPLEIQQGFYSKKTYVSAMHKVAANIYKKTGTYVNELPFIHYSFGAGSWTLHTPFKVDVYKEGALIATQEIDTVGGTGVYRIPGSGDEFINIIDLGKLSTGYGEPQWDDILYFSENHIFVRSVTADNLLRYDSGQTPSEKTNTLGSVTADCFNSYWFGKARWLDDSSPAAFYPSQFGSTLYPSDEFPGWYRQDTSLEFINRPRQPDVFNDVLPYLQNRGVQKVSMPTGFDRLEKTADNKLRVHMRYGTYSSLITIKISTALADTIVWQPQVANFEITSFPDFGDITDTRTASITIKCLEGTGSATITLTKDPTDTPASFTPTLGTQPLTTGQSQTLNFDILNLGTPSTVDFSITASVMNVLGTVTDTSTASGKLLQKTGATTIVHVITQEGNKPISNLPVMIEYSGTSQTKTTGLDGLGTATFNLGTSTDISVKATFAGNALYKPVSRTASVSGGSEKTITLPLTKEELVPEAFDWTLIIMLAAVLVAGIVIFYMWKQPRRGRRRR